MVGLCELDREVRDKLRSKSLAIGTRLADLNTMLGNLALGLALTPRQLVKKEVVTEYTMHLASGFLSSSSVG